jgi:hypothetical protein
MRALFVCVLLLSISGSILFVSGREQGQGEKGKAQASESKATNDQIEVKEDRFSGVTIVKLKPQVILDKTDYRLTIDIETKLGEKKSYDWQKDEIKAIVSFEAQSKSPTQYGDRELHFLTDGKPLNLGKVDIEVDPHADRTNKLQSGFKIRETFLKIISRPGLEQFSKANRIEMRLGSIEPALSPSVMLAMRKYADRVLTLQKNVKERKP